MKSKLKLILGFVVIFIFVFTVFYSSTSQASMVQTSECRWSKAISGGGGDFFFCGYYDNPLHCNCGDIV